jgi:hypothetical protein
MPIAAAVLRLTPAMQCTGDAMHEQPRTRREVGGEVQHVEEVLAAGHDVAVHLLGDVVQVQEEVVRTVAGEAGGAGADEADRPGRPALPEQVRRLGQRGDPEVEHGGAG